MKRWSGRWPKYDDLAASSTLRLGLFLRVFSDTAARHIPDDGEGVRSDTQRPLLQLWRSTPLRGEASPTSGGTGRRRGVCRRLTDRGRGGRPARRPAPGQVRQSSAATNPPRCDGGGRAGATPPWRSSAAEHEAMGTRIGFDHYAIGHRGLSAWRAGSPGSHGLDGVQFLEPSEVRPDARPRALAAVRTARPRRWRLYLEVGIPSPNPVRRSREEGRSVSAAEHAADLARQVEAVAALGCRYARAFVGDRHDRFRRDTSWPDQIAATCDVLRRLTPVLREFGVKVALETHADLTVDELFGILDRLDPGVAGVTLDTGNLVMRLDDPVRAAERLAPRVIATHVKDCVLARTPRGLCWQARPVGSGALPLPEHARDPAAGATPPLNPSRSSFTRGRTTCRSMAPPWLAYFPDLAPRLARQRRPPGRTLREPLHLGLSGSAGGRRVGPLGRPRPRLAGPLAGLSPECRPRAGAARPPRVVDPLTA